MQLTFESLAELKDFMGWIGELAQPRGQATPKATIVVQDLPIADGEAAEEIVAPPTSQTAQSADNPSEPRRKRRTKAEMEAARAAEAENPFAQAPTQEEQRQAAATEAADSPAAAVGDAPPVQTAPINKGDSADFIKSRLVERPEVSQVEHLNLARTFIGKHGMEKYNASFPLAGLTPNVMGYSPADCATHAAALDFLSLE